MVYFFSRQCSLSILLVYIENAKFRTILAHDGHLHYFWCTFTSPNDAVVYQNWQILGVAVNSAHVHCLLGKNATDNLRMLQMMQCNLCETILSIKRKCFCDGDPAKKVVLKEGK